MYIYYIYIHIQICVCIYIYMVCIYFEREFFPSVDHSYRRGLLSTGLEATHEAASSCVKDKLARSCHEASCVRSRMKGVGRLVPEPQK